MAGTWTTWSCFSKTFFLTKNKSNFMCLVWECIAWLWARAIMLRFSQKMTSEWWGMRNSDNKDLIHATFAVAKARLWYLAYVLDLVTTNCFFDH